MQDVRITFYDVMVQGGTLHFLKRVRNGWLKSY